MGFNVQRILYFHMPRTAGDSVRNSIQNSSQMCCNTTHHHPSATLAMKTHMDISDKGSFTFVRNPYNRLYSAYNWIMKRDIKRNEELNSYDLKEYEYLKQYEDFNHFCRNIDEEIINQDFMIHFYPLNKWIWDSKLLITNIFKFEDLFNGSTLFEDWCKQKGLIYNGLVDKTHMSDWTEKNYFHYFTSDSLTNTYNLYKKDFELFGYDEKK